MGAKRRRKVLAQHLERRPSFLKEWSTPEQVMFDMIENPLSSLGKRKNEVKSVSTHNYLGTTRRGVAALLSELFRKGILERKGYPQTGATEYRRKVS